MSEFIYIPTREVDARHRAARGLAREHQPRGTARPPSAEPRLRNVEPVLDLGTVRYYRVGRFAFGIPPLAFKTGHQILDAYTKAMALALVMSKGGTTEQKTEYYRTLDTLSRLLWKYSFPAGRRYRIMRRLGMLRNPFARATEQEILDIANFFLRGRTMSSVMSLSTPPA